MSTNDKSSEILNQLYLEAEKRINSGADPNARERYLRWLMDPTASEIKKARIQEVFVWCDSIWDEYLALREILITKGNCPWYNKTKPCPWSFWDIKKS